MKRIKLERVVNAIGNLQQVRLNRRGQWLPGFLCLKSHGLAESSTIKVRGADYVEFAQSYYAVQSPPNPAKPFFDPTQSKQPWKNSNWPMGTFHSRNDRSHLVASEVLEVSAQAAEREYTLKSGYLTYLAEYFDEGSPKIPALDFACWIFRNEPLTDDFNPEKLVERLWKTLRLTEAEIAVLFDIKITEGDPDVFTSENWSIKELTTKLPAPDESVAAKTEKTTEEDEQEQLSSEHIADDDTFVSAILAHFRDVEHFEVEAKFLRTVLAAMRTDRFVILCGKPGTGKTEFVRILHRALAHVLSGSAEVKLSHHEVHPETAEWEILGTRDLSGDYVPSPLMTDISKAVSENTIHLILLDEMNRGSVDSYGGRLIAAVSNQVPIDLPGRVTTDGLPSDGKWVPHSGIVLFGAINSHLTEPSRLPLSGPVKRRAHLIPMPDPLHAINLLDEKDRFPAFLSLCKERLVPQLRDKISRRGPVTSLDADLGSRLASPPSDEILKKLWLITSPLLDRIEVSFTLGVIQSLIAFLVTLNADEELDGLDYALVNKVIPQLQGDIIILEELEAALGSELPRSLRAVTELKVYAEETGDRVNPIY